MPNREDHDLFLWGGIALSILLMLLILGFTAVVMIKDHFPGKPDPRSVRGEAAGRAYVRTVPSPRLRQFIADSNDLTYNMGFRAGVVKEMKKMEREAVQS